MFIASFSVEGLDHLINNVSSLPSISNADKRPKTRKRKKTANHTRESNAGGDSESDDCSSGRGKKYNHLSNQRDSSDGFSEDLSTAPDSPKFGDDHDRSAVEHIEPSRILEQSMATAEVGEKDDDLLSFSSPNENDGFDDEGMENSLFDGNPIISLTESNGSDGMLLPASTSTPQGEYFLCPSITGN